MLAITMTSTADLRVTVNNAGGYEEIYIFLLRAIIIL